MPENVLSLDQILSTVDNRFEAVSVPEWGGTVYVRSITADERDKFEAEMTDGNLVGLRAKLVGACLCDKQGESLNPSPAQIKALGRKAAAPLDRVFEVCRRLNGMRQEDMESAEKNSAAMDDSGAG